MGVQQIDTFGPTPESGPSGLEPVQPPAAAMPGAVVGDVLSKAGSELTQLGMEEYQRAVNAQAQDKETEFQTKALQLRDQYRQLFQLNALDAHEKYSQALTTLREQVGGSLSSKRGRELFNNNSLRSLRFVQESIDSHFEAQNKAYQVATYKQGEQADATMVATLASDARYDPAKVQAVIESRQAKALEFAQQHGMDPDTAEKFAVNSTQRLTDALFKMMFDKHSQVPQDVISSEVEKYKSKGMIDPKRLEDAEKALNGVAGETWVSRTMANMVRVDHQGRPDPEGYIPYSAVSAALRTLKPTDPAYETKQEALLKAWRRTELAFQQAGAEKSEDMIARGVVGNQSDFDWQAFSRLYPGLAKKMAGKEQDRAYTLSRRSALSNREASHAAYGETRAYLDSLTPEEARDVTPATVNQIIRTAYKGSGVNPDPNDMAKAQEFLKKVQSGQLDPMERRFSVIAREVLSEAYKGDTSKVRAMMNKAALWLDDTYGAAKGKMSEEDLRKGLLQVAQKPGVFSPRPLESYGSPGRSPTPPVKQASSPPPGKYKRADGSFGNWDGSKWVD